MSSQVFILAIEASLRSTLLGPLGGLALLLVFGRAMLNEGAEGGAWWWWERTSKLSGPDALAPAGRGRGARGRRGGGQSRRSLFSIDLHRPTDPLALPGPPLLFFPDMSQVIPRVTNPTIRNGAFPLPLKKVVKLPPTFNRAEVSVPRLLRSRSLRPSLRTPPASSLQPSPDS